VSFWIGFHFVRETLQLLECLNATGNVNNHMKIGEAAQASGVSNKMIRHYEEIGLLPANLRRTNGYRDYGDSEVHELRFIRRGRDLGFGLADIGKLLDLWRNKARHSFDVKALAKAHAAELNRKIAEMEAMRDTLQQLATACNGDNRPDCPIINDLAARS
jgi:MerR family transcriptional regulator, copper efflux regulator